MKACEGKRRGAAPTLSSVASQLHRFSSLPTAQKMRADTQRYKDACCTVVTKKAAAAVICVSISLGTGQVTYGIRLLLIYCEMQDDTAIRKHEVHPYVLTWESLQHTVKRMT